MWIKQIVLCIIHFFLFKKWLEQIKMELIQKQELHLQFVALNTELLYASIDIFSTVLKSIFQTSSKKVDMLIKVWNSIFHPERPRLRLTFYRDHNQV